MSCTETYVFVDPMLDLRSDPDRARTLGKEFAHELSRGHVLHGRHWNVVAEAMPQDEVLVSTGDLAFLVHLTWSRRAEKSPRPLAELADSAEEFERLVKLRY